MTHQHSDDRPDPSEQPIRARVPEHVAGGAFSTGVIVMTAQTEFILDFVQNLGRPHQIVARVVMPHNVLPQLVDALQRNIELYRNRWGELPQIGLPKPPAAEGPASASAATPSEAGSPGRSGQAAHLAAGQQAAAGGGSAAGSAGGSSGSSGSSGPGSSSSPPPSSGHASPTGDEPPQSGGQATGRQASVQDIYDDLKIRDEILSGAYANAVMIGHGPHEFSFDFITNFYPHSAVSARVFLAAGQIPRLFESLKGTWEQMRSRMQPPPPGRQPPPPTSFSDEDNPFA